MIGYSKSLSWVKRHKWYVVLFLMFVLSFNFNIFGLGQNDKWFASFQESSSGIVKKTAECNGVIEDYSGPLNASFRVVTQRGCPSDTLKPYVSQFGLQARVAYGFSSIFSNFERGLKIIEISLTLVFASVLTILVWKFRNEFGSYVAVSTAIGLLISPWIAAFSYNLYWVVFTIFLPFIFSLCAYEYFKKSRRMWVFYCSLFSLFLLKFLNGYEYASTMVFSAFIPVALFELRRIGFRPFLALWRQAVLIAGTGFIALILAITANAAALKSYTGGWNNAFQVIGGRVEERSSVNLFQSKVISSIKGTANPIYQSIDRIYDLDKLSDGGGNSVKYAMLSAVNYMMLPAVSLPFILKEPFGTIIQSIFAITLVSALILWHLKKQRYQIVKVQRLSILYLLGLLGALSWLLLMPGHTYVHPHINAIIFYLPFLFACYGILGLYIQYVTSRAGLKVIKSGKKK